MAHSVERPTLAQVTMSQFVSWSPASGSVPTAQSLEPASDSVSPSPSAPPLACTLSVSLSLSFSKIKIQTLKKKKKRKGNIKPNQKRKKFSLEI